MVSSQQERQAGRRLPPLACCEFAAAIVISSDVWDRLNPGVARMVTFLVLATR